jgi:hypothetical protein
LIILGVILGGLFYLIFWSRPEVWVRLEPYFAFVGLFQMIANSLAAIEKAVNGKGD